MAWDPLSREVSLDVTHLAMIGLIALHEAKAKYFASLTVRTLNGLSHCKWLELERSQLAQLEILMVEGAQKLDDAKLSKRIQDFAEKRSSAQDLRHTVIHATWSFGPDGKPSAYDIRRKLWLSTNDINKALKEIQNLARLAEMCVRRVAELIDEKKLPERAGEGGASFYLSGRWIKI